ncbi:SET and MYND domain-containing protein 4-like isoform X1 [Rhopilema esculentum]|uniref:SET and MYND domain-containing protein 4-like isoform X1 n=1 Tax=Rhopilema esculentum TaxID=499914 RepID=UPI0031D371B9|eukprot:gene936-10692_t
MAGTFASLFTEISQRLSENKQVDCLSSEFRLCDTDEERISCILKTELVDQALKEWPHWGQYKDQKSSSLSEKLRLQGNSLFKKQSFTAALEKYTDSVFNADYCNENSQCFALALANRSAVLFQLCDFSDAINDAERALAYGYPEKLKYKLLERIGKCHVKQNRQQFAKKYFKAALMALSKSDLSVDQKNKHAFEYCKMEKQCSPENLKDKSQPWCEKEGTAENEKADSNPIYPCATSAFEIVCDPSFGRHAIATREIDAGELIIFEKPYAAVLFHENRLTHCYHCFKRCKTLIGCPTCSFVGFCDFACKDLAVQSYHECECKFLSTLYLADVGLGHLALQMVIKAGFDYLFQFKENGRSSQSGLNADGVYDSLDYISVFSLIGHSDKRSLSDLFKRAVMAVFLMKFVDHNEFFTSPDDVEMQFAKKVCIGAHILKQLQMLPCNAHEVSELQIDRSSIADSYLKEIGSAIYATLSLLNHSCDPSVVRHSYGSSCALRAVKQIPKGGMIIDNYGSLYAVNNFQERQSLVSSQYFFICQCEPCSGSWPMYHELPSDFPGFQCPECNSTIKSKATSSAAKLRCSACHLDLGMAVADFELSRSNFTQAMETVLNGDCPKKHLPSLLRHLQLVCKIIKLPWQEFNNCQEIVKQCFSMLGNHNDI